MKANTCTWLVAAGLTLAAACGGKKSGDANTAPDNITNTPATGVNSQPAAAPGEADAAIVSFKVNGVAANTKPGAANDDDKHIALFNKQNKFLSMSLNGDDPQFPHRGYLTISSENFDGQPGVKKCWAGFSRYATANAGGETMYNAKAGEFNLNITGMEKTTDSNLGGDVWYATGTFSGKLAIKQGYKNDVTVIDITEGSFSKVPVMGYGK